MLAIFPRFDVASPPNTKEIISSNLRALIDLHQWSERVLAEKSKVAQKTVNKILNQESSPSAETIEKLAKAFGLNGWQLMLPNMPTDLLESPSLQVLFDNYASSSGAGREYINRIAAKEAAYRNSGS